MFNKLISKLKQKPFLLILILILSVITIGAIKPNFYLIGWDNYSSYFNIKNSLLRTFFSTWREYRGLGVPSDSEITDIFRQIFFLLLKPFVSITLLDQLYILLILWSGTLTMYMFSLTFLNKALNNKLGNTRKDLTGFLAAFFYLFNLNTLATFYFPMIMYINRYFAIPLIFLIFLKFITEKINSKRFFFFCFLILFSSGTFMTATIIIPILISLLIFGLMNTNFKKTILFLIFFLGMNSFWILPFANYTIQKSSIIRLAPTFIDTNETQLNKPKSFYSYYRQLILYPNFFDTRINNTDLTQKTFFHPLTNQLDKFPYSQILFIFPVFYLIGCFTIIKLRDRRLYWIPISIILFLLLSLKEFSPLGFSYTFLDKLTPLFGVLFRFGDTKFHPIIAFSGSIGAACCMVYILDKVSKLLPIFKKSVYVLIFILIIFMLLVFKDYLTGNLIGYFMYNKIPQPYFDIAKLINQDKDDVRVLHLSFDKNGYWKSYSWGAIGSSFFHFMIDKPCIDKTFEPASMENADLHKKIYDLINNTQATTSNNAQFDKTNQFYQLLKGMGIKYLIFDKSVSPEIYPRGITLWGKFNSSESQAMINNLVSSGLITPVYSGDINIWDYMKLYDKISPISDSKMKEISNNPISQITLYEVNQVNPKISFIDKISVLDSHFTNYLGSDLPLFEKRYLQNDNLIDYEIYPFKRNDLQISLKNSQTSLSIKNPVGKSSNFTIRYLNKRSDKESSKVMLDIYVKQNKDDLIFIFYRINAPKINNQEFKDELQEITIPLKSLEDNLLMINDKNNYISNWQVLPYSKFSGLRLQIGDTILPVPYNFVSNETYLGSVVVNSNDIKVDILNKSDSKTIDSNSYSLTDNPNCFGDKLSGFSYSIDDTNNQFNLKTKNGSFCFWKDLKDVIDDKTKHIEMTMNYESSNKDLDDQYGLDYKNISKPILKKIIAAALKPNYLNICIKEYNVADCYNSHQVVQLDGNQEFVIPIDKSINGINDLLVFFALKNTSYQEQTVKIKSLKIDLYNSIKSYNLKVSSSDNFSSEVSLSKGEDLKLSFHQPVSYFSFYQNNGRDGFFLSNQPCYDDNSYRTFRLIDRKLISYFENCSNVISHTNNFSSNNFYLWSVDYNLMSGKYPKFIMDDGFFHYVDEYMSLYQGYPDVGGFKSFQAPEFLASSDGVKKTIDNLQYKTAYTFIYPNFNYRDSRIKNYTIHHDSENEGVMAIDNINIIELPSYWNDLVLTPKNNIIKYDIPFDFSYKQILPSLWKVQLNSTSQNNLMLYFNEAYDSQWGIYDNLFGLIFGRSKAISHNKCDGYANCFELNPNQYSFYVFYVPERLNLLGWGISLITLLIFSKIIIKNLFKVKE